MLRTLPVHAETVLITVRESVFWAPNWHYRCSSSLSRAVGAAYLKTAMVCSESS